MPRIGDDFVNCAPQNGDGGTLGVVDFPVFPHLGNLPDNTTVTAEGSAAEAAGPGYGIDDQTAIEVTGGTVEVVSDRLTAAANSGRRGQTPTHAVEWVLLAVMRT